MTAYDHSNLTRSQQLMWIGQQLNPSTPLYNMIQTYRIAGDLQVDALRQAIDFFVANTRIMRTTVDVVDDTPQITIKDTVNYSVEFVDLSAEQNADASFEGWLNKRRAEPFDLDTCLFDTAIIKLADENFVWYLAFHHLITDAVSFDIVYRHMSALYQQAINGKVMQLMQDVPDHSAFRAYEQSVIGTPRHEKAVAFWEEQLAKPVEPIHFYNTNPTTLSTRTERVPLTLDDSLYARLATFLEDAPVRSFSQDLTTANIFGALLIAYLYQINGHNSIRLGMPFANRMTPTFEQMPGVLIEMLSLTIDIEDDYTFIDLLEQVKRSNLDALKHLVPGMTRADHNRAYDVVLNFIPLKMPDFAGMPTVVDWVHSGYGDSNHKLRVQIHDLTDSGTYKIYFDFNQGIFNSWTQEQTFKHFQMVLEGCLENPTTPLRSLNLLDDAAWQSLVIDFNDTDSPYDTQSTVIDLFEAQVAKTPDAIAVMDGDVQLTYAHLNREANRFAHYLVSEGIERGALVPICMEHGSELLIAILGILKAGCAYVPIDPSYPDERIAHIFADLRSVPITVASDTYAERFDNHSTSVITVGNSNTQAEDNLSQKPHTRDLAYTIFTSGSTGTPKGVLVEHDGLSNYIQWASKQYAPNTPQTFALYSSLAFDLTVTSIYVPLITGGTIRIYSDAGGSGTIVRDIFVDDAVDVIKLTPSHLELVRDMSLVNKRIKTLIVGGEDFKTELAMAIHRNSNGGMTLFNEYGPTEATVACMLHEYHAQNDFRESVPIGTPADNMRIYVLDKHLRPVPAGVVGEMYISGVGVARAYLNRPDLTAEKFMPDPFDAQRRMYKTGDIAKWLPTGQLAFLGRADRQVKVSGFRIELGEVEAVLRNHPAIRSATARVQNIEIAKQTNDAEVSYCARCGIADNYPGITFDEAQVCSICTAYDGYKDKAQQYFEDMDTLKTLAETVKTRSTGEYDCVALLSGGKDSSYMVYRLVDMGLNVLTFTLDNGYISDDAKANIRRITDALGVDHVFGETPFMDDIFVDSLQRYANVCNGCFKTIYTLAVNLARQKGISTIFTGLSRGQFFETRLTEELFTDDDFDVTAIDASIARARRAYHQRDDIISRSLDVDVFRDEETLEDIAFIDFYRYCDVDLDDLYDFLENHAPWIRPSDTGRSTNCLINDVGIYVHKKRRGFHNYALPYSWDVRMGHKTREQAIEELNDNIDETHVQRIMREIGYTQLNDEDTSLERLVGYYVADGDVSATDIRAYLAEQLPEYMIPSYFVALDEMPLTTNGKINYDALPSVSEGRANLGTAYVAPEDDLQETIAEMWQTFLHLERVGIHDNFFDLGGHSLPAIRITSRINDLYDITLPLNTFFAHPTVRELAIAIEDMMMADIDALSDEEVLRLLEETDDDE